MGQNGSLEALGVVDRTSSFFFSSFSSLKFAIFVARRAFGSMVEMVEKEVGDSV